MPVAEQQQATVGVAYVSRQADTLAPEDQNRSLGELDFPQRSRGVGAGEESFAERWQDLVEGGPAWPQSRIDPRPIVEPGAPHLLVVEREAEGLDQVELRTG